LGFATASLDEIGRHDFSDKAFFIVDLEGFAIGNPTYDDTIVCNLLFLLVVFLWYVVCGRVVDAQAVLRFLNVPFLDLL